MWATQSIRCSEAGHPLPLHGFGAAVLEIRTTGASGIYRTVYTVALPSAIYVLHAFQKKLPRGIATARRTRR